jgi:hypothetical protein
MAAATTDSNFWTILSSYIVALASLLTLLLSWLKEGGRKRARRSQIIQEASAALSYLELELKVHQLSADEETLQSIRSKASKDVFKVREWAVAKLLFSGSPLEEDQGWGDQIRREIKKLSIVKRLLLRLPEIKGNTRFKRDFKALRNDFYSRLASTLLNALVMGGIAVLGRMHSKSAMQIGPTLLLFALIQLVWMQSLRQSYAVAISGYVAARLSRLILQQTEEATNEDNV